MQLQRNDLMCNGPIAILQRRIAGLQRQQQLLQSTGTAEELHEIEGQLLDAYRQLSTLTAIGAGNSVQARP